MLYKYHCSARMCRRVTVLAVCVCVCVCIYICCYICSIIVCLYIYAQIKIHRDISLSLIGGLSQKCFILELWHLLLTATAYGTIPATLVQRNISSFNRYIYIHVPVETLDISLYKDYFKFHFGHKKDFHACTPENHNFLMPRLPMVGVKQ